MSLNPRATALATLRRCAEQLAREISASERQRLNQLHGEALAVLEQYGHRPGTRRRAERLRGLEHQLASMATGERVAAIRARMGLSRSGYYKLRRIALSLRTNVDS